MNLNVLNDGTVATKAWLNPVCNVLTCNELIQANPLPEPTDQYFSVRTTLAASIPANGGVEIFFNILTSGTSYDLPTNKYLCPKQGVLNLSFYGLFGGASPSGVRLVPILNGVDFSVPLSIFIIDTAIQFSGTGNWLVNVNANDVLGFKIINSSGVNALTISNAFLNCFYI